jgi:rare lipoprotein A
MRKYILTTCAILVHNIINIVDHKSKTPSIPKAQKTESPKEIVVVKKIDNLHTATWYNLHGNKTASGDRFHRDSLTAAYNHSKLGSYLKITNVSNDETIVVKVNDRMGIKKSNRIDLSKCAFDSIASIGSGRIKVKIEVIQKG